MVLLLAQDSKDCGQQEFRGLISCMGFRELSSVVLLPGELSLLACAFCYPWSSGSHAILHRVLISLVFQGEGSRSYIRGEHGALSYCVCREVELTTK
jgi:hypothetical protein